MIQSHQRELAMDAVHTMQPAKNQHQEHVPESLACITYFTLPCCFVFLCNRYDKQHLTGDRLRGMKINC